MSNYYHTFDQDLLTNDLRMPDDLSIFSPEEIDALFLIDAEFGEDVAEDVAEKVAAAGRLSRAFSNARESLADLTYGKASGVGRFRELLTGSRFKRMRRFTGQSKSVLSAARGNAPDNREARKVLATRLATGGAAAALLGGGAAALSDKKASGSVEDLALDLLDFAGYDVW